jgi:hypothetical protein
MDWIDVVADRKNCHVVVNAVVYIRVLNDVGNLLTS